MAADATIKLTQSWLTQLGYDIGTADGVWGNRSQGALDALKASTVKPGTTYGVSKLAWGKKLTDAETAKLAQVIQRLKMSPVTIQDFMGCIAWESNKTFSPSVKAPNSSATGLIQFMDATAKGLGTTTAALAKMTVIEQLEYVYNYFKPYAGRLNNLGDLYMAILWPRGIGQPDSYVLWDEAIYPAPFAANKGLDLNNDHKVTRMECLHKVNNRLVEGFLPANVKAV